ncbi:MAG: NUDIX domain-containing protein [Chloroflexi bacterium]|nr:NUDIX domain-containing protein [Chloroflexota bacterium]
MLLLAHPYAGNQFPSGTVEENETLDHAVLREVAEEAGLVAPQVRIVKQIDALDDNLSEQTRIVTRKTKVYARPDATSFDWAEFRRGVWVNVEREQNGFTQVTYEELDDYPNGNYVSYRITGWVPSDALTAKQRRHFFHLIADGDTPETWTQFSDNHTFRLFWSPLAALAEIVYPQNRQFEYVRNELGYRFD